MALKIIDFYNSCHKYCSDFFAFVHGDPRLKFTTLFKQQLVYLLMVHILL